MNTITAKHSKVVFRTLLGGGITGRVAVEFTKYATQLLGHDIYAPIY